MSAAFVFGLQTNMARSQHLAEFELYWGDANLLKLELDHYLAVTNDDIKRVAATIEAGAYCRYAESVLPSLGQ